MTMKMTSKMSLRRSLALALVAAGSIVAAFGVVYASDPMAVYARVDKVVLEPNAGAPQTAQVWGVFSMAKPDDRNDFLAPARGYLYFKLPAGSTATALQEWADLKAVAGTGQLVAFGSRYQLKARLRKPDERPDAPDAYNVNFGMTKVNGRTDYAPVRALLDFKD